MDEIFFRNLESQLNFVRIELEKIGEKPKAGTPKTDFIPSLLLRPRVYTTIEEAQKNPFIVKSGGKYQAGPGYLAEETNKKNLRCKEEKVARIIGGLI